MCLRRTALIADLSGYIEQAWRLRRGRPQLLAVPDAKLLDWAGEPAFAARYEAFSAEAAVDVLTAAGVGAVCRCSGGYPARVLELPDPPAVLHVRGDAAALAAGGVALVGARRASAAGLEVARSLSRGLAAAGIPVVSGMALGVDGAAHAGVLDAGGVTLAVLATGADTPYPARHGGLHRRIAAGPGCVVAELPPGTTARRWAFPARNRVIAALADVTIVVEGGGRSGSLITADFAMDLGRPVGAVPGPVTSTLSEGPNLLIKSGAELVRGPADVLELLASVPAASTPADRPRLFGQPAAPDRMPVPEPSDLAERPRGTLRRVEAGEDTMAALAAGGADVSAVMVDLGELEVRGLVRRMPDGRYVRALQ